MGQLFIMVLVVGTSAGACAIGARVLGLSRSAVRVAIGRGLECIGAGLVFFVANVAVGVALVAAARFMTRGFVSLYLASDVTLLILSLLQGLIFQWWRELSQAPAAGK